MQSKASCVMKKTYNEANIYQPNGVIFLYQLAADRPSTASFITDVRSQQTSSSDFISMVRARRAFQQMNTKKNLLDDKIFIPENKKIFIENLFGTKTNEK